MARRRPPGCWFYLSALCTYDDCLDAGERGIGLFLATTAQQAKLAFERAAGIVDNSPLLRSMVTGKTADTISLSNSVDLAIRPASPRGLRGVTAIGICCDEAAHFLTEGTNSDTEVLTAVRPSLATTGGMLMITSTPYWEQGELVRWHDLDRGLWPAPVVTDPLLATGQKSGHIRSRKKKPTYKPPANRLGFA